MGRTHTRLHDRNKTRQIWFLCQGGTGFKGKPARDKSSGERCRWLTGSHDGVATDRRTMNQLPPEAGNDVTADWRPSIPFWCPGCPPFGAVPRRGFVGIVLTVWVPREFRGWGSVGGCRDATTTLGCQWHDERLKRVGVASCCRRVEAAVSLTTSERGTRGLPCSVQCPVPCAGPGRPGLASVWVLDPPWLSVVGLGRSRMLLCHQSINASAPNHWALFLPRARYPPPAFVCLNLLTWRATRARVEM